MPRKKSSLLRRVLKRYAEQIELLTHATDKFTFYYNELGQTQEYDRFLYLAHKLHGIFLDLLILHDKKRSTRKVKEMKVLLDEFEDVCDSIVDTSIALYLCHSIEQNEKDTK